MQPDYFTNARDNMLRTQVRQQFMLDDNVINIMKNIPRENFTPETYKKMAYAEIDIPIGQGQTMMKPNEEARMLQALNISANDSVLEIGTGSGYITCMLANMAKNVCSIDYYESFIKMAHLHLQPFKLNNIELLQMDASQELPKNKRFNIICVTAGLPLLPKSFLNALNVNGRLFAIIGSQAVMQATLIHKTSDDAFTKEVLFETKIPEMLNAPQYEIFNF